MNSVAMISAHSESATCVTTRPPRALSHRVRREGASAPSGIAPTVSLFEACNAGARPLRRVTSMARPAVSSQRRPSNVKVRSCRTYAGTAVRSHARPQYAPMRPHAVATTTIRRLSVRN